MVALISRQAETFGQEYTLAGSSVTMVGRAPDNDIVLDGSSVSRHHARIEETAAGYLLHDLSSKNGTWVNDQRVEERAALHDGDMVRFGDLTFVFRAYGESTTTMRMSAPSWSRAMGAPVLELRELRSRLAPDGTVTILFSDIEGSTAIAERLGDRRWLDLLREHDRIVREQIAQHSGFEVKSQGDGFMVAFQSAHRGLLCAVAIQRAFAASREEFAEEPLRLRVGLHAGEALKEADDFFGRTVIVAARIAALARGGEILASALLKELVESIGDVAFDEGRDVALKGLSGVWWVYPVRY